MGDEAGKIRRPYPLNVEGDFYVEDGCCITCGVMHEVAPNLFSWGDHHCYVAKQPSTPAELEQMIEATDVTEAGCVRYRGTDRNFLRRLVERGQADLLDVGPPTDAQPYGRDRTVFEVMSAELSAEALATDFSAWARGRGTRSHVSFVVSGPAAAFYSNNEEISRVAFSSDQAANLCMGIVSASVDWGFNRMTGMVFEWQSQHRLIRGVRWLTVAEIERGATGEPRPS